MADSKQTTNPIPVLLAVLVCDVAVADPSTGKKNLIGIFDKIFVGKFPATRPISVYIKLTDAKGDYSLTIQFILSETGEQLGEARGELKSSNPLEAVDAHVAFPPLLIPRPGRYEFRIFADAIYLGSAVIDAVSHDSIPSKEQA